MKEPKNALGISRLVLLAVALLLPALSLVPLGSIWLWQHGYVLYWALAMSVVVAGVYYLERRLIVPLPVGGTTGVDDAQDHGDGAWTPRQAQACSRRFKAASNSTAMPARVACRTG